MYPLEVFEFNPHTGVLKTQYSTLSLNGARPVFRIGTMGWNYLSFDVMVNGIPLRYVVRKTIMKEDWVNFWILTPTKFAISKNADCEGTKILLFNDLMFQPPER